MSLNQFVTFTIDDNRYALSLNKIERVVSVVDITPLPEGPEIVHGVINVGGKIIAVVNIRKRFKLPDKEIGIYDQLIIAHLSKRMIALLVDRVLGVINISEERIISSDKILDGMEYIDGIAKDEDGIVLIHDLDRFLSLDEEEELSSALRK